MDQVPAAGRRQITPCAQIEFFREVVIEVQAFQIQVAAFGGKGFALFPDQGFLDFEFGEKAETAIALPPENERNFIKLRLLVTTRLEIETGGRIATPFESGIDINALIGGNCRLADYQGGSYTGSSQQV